MQPDTTSTSTATSSKTYHNTYPMTQEKRFTDYLSDTGSAAFSGASKTATYFVDHPLLSGSMIVGGIGAFLGSRLAYMLAERRRKSTYDRAMESVSLFVNAVGAALSPKNRERAVKQVSHVGKDILGRSQEVSSTFMERIPLDRLPRDRFSLDRVPMMDRMQPEKEPSTMQKVGYGLSLIPVTLALVRNPLVRDVAFRFASRRLRSNRGR